MILELVSKCKFFMIIYFELNVFTGSLTMTGIFLFQLENAKRAKLKNPNIFVSTTRLSVHNIPTQVTDNQLKTMFLKAADSKAAVITEVIRIK